MDANFPQMPRVHHAIRRIRSSTRRSLVAVLCSAITLGAQPSLTGGVQVTVVGGATGLPIPYAVVKLPDAAAERFTNSDGVASFVSLSAGAQRVDVRRIGYRQYSGVVQVESGRTARLAVTLERLPVRLARMEVRANGGCVRPGIPDADVEPDVYRLTELLRENAEQYRFLTKRYPFRYVQARALGEHGQSTFYLQRVDSILISSAGADPYRRGDVVRSSDSGQFSMMLPSISDLADTAFVNAHCFEYGGTVRTPTKTLMKLVVRAAERIRTPDVNGAFYIDSSTAQLELMELQLTRPKALPKQLSNIAGISSSTSFRDIVPGLSVIDRVCAVTTLRRPSEPGVRPAELQSLLYFEFLEVPPDAAPQTTRPMPYGWRDRGRLPLRDLWCEPRP
jgi:hypothetical protein